MKKIFLLLAAGALMCSCAKEQVSNLNTNSQKASFIGTIEDTRVSTSSGVSVWETGDLISVFSVADGADPGVSAGTNVLYKVREGGSTAVFDPNDGVDIATSDKYYAYFNGMATYPYKLNAVASIGFAGVDPAGSPITDYRFMPVTVNETQNFTVDTETGIGKMTSADSKLFYAVAEAPANPDQAVELSFKPVLPILEIGLLGHGEKVSKMQFEDLSVAATDDAKNAAMASNEWLSSKGVFDLSTGVLTTTNASKSAFRRIIANITTATDSYVTLDPVKAARMQLNIGRFNVTKGLKITFTLSDGSTVVKTIWADKTVSGVDANGKCKHIYQPVMFPYVVADNTALSFTVDGGSQDVTVTSSKDWTLKSKPEWITVSPESGVSGAKVTVTASANAGAQRNGSVVFEAEGVTFSLALSQAAATIEAADYYKISLSDIDWTASYIQSVKSAQGSTVAVITKEYLGATVDRQAIVAYPMSMGKPDFTKGLVAVVTIDQAGAAPAANVHGGSISISDMVPGNAVYTPGTAAAATEIYVKSDGTAVYTSNPATGGQTVSAGQIVPDVLVSDVCSHPEVKLGTQIWTATCYKTTKDNKGVAYSQCKVGDTRSAGNRDMWIVNDEIYIYSGYALGHVNGGPFSDNISPEGWRMCMATEYYSDLGGFLGGTAMYAKINSNITLLSSTIPYKSNASKSGDIYKYTAPSQLSYYNTWSSTLNSGESSFMAMAKPGTAPGTSGQSILNMFDVFLIKE
ncbi:MAG: hypothetical protein MJY62_02730 [Bacteroidales bacterium]|nr:hypothetical protein [Bacteroidales bacterium]